MKVAVAVKMVLDCGVHLAIDETGKIVRQKDQSPLWVVNGADRAALEASLKIKEEIKDTEILAVNFGQAQGEECLYYALARGADRAVLIEDSDGVSGDTHFAGQVLAGYFRREQPDLILCGHSTTDSGMGCVGPFIAEHLTLPQITGAVKAEVSANEKRVITVRRLEKGNREVIECALPAVVSVDPIIMDPKYVSVNAYMLVKKKKIERIDLKKLDMNEGDRLRTRTIKIEPPRPRTKRTSTPDSKLSPSERMKFIMSGGMSKNKESEILTGSPEHLANEIFEFLLGKGLLG